MKPLPFRDELVKKLELNWLWAVFKKLLITVLLKTRKVFMPLRNTAQIPTLLDTIEKNKFDAAMGGARRDEEKARAKERFFSHRDDFGNGIPKINDQNYGTYSMVKRNSVSTFVFFQSVIGPKWIFGNILRKKILIYRALFFP